MLNSMFVEYWLCYLEHTVSTPAIHPLYRTLLKQSWITLTIHRETTVTAIHN